MISALLNFEFLQNAFLSGLIIGVIAPLLGLFIVVRRLALIADALSHVALAGIAGSLYLSQSVLFFSALNPIYLGMATAVGGSLLIERLRGAYKNFEELAIPIILSAGIGFGAIFISLAKGFGSDLVGYLFGSVSAVSRQDLWVIVTIAIVVIAFIRFFYKELFALSFDKEYAKVSGINGKIIQTVFMIIVALVIGASMRIVGILLVSSLMTIPVAAAIQLAKSFKGAMLLSITIGELSVIVGLFSAYHLDIAPGGTIVITSIIILLGVLGWNKFKGKKRVGKVKGDLMHDVG
ncbi:metal ABC transporter permease [Sporosarcina sp. Sa2YVA2]|uniref:Metal ABC transporter permease n=1 Tax=Sporosarcina quadrami TaxID=2762234 RepID=A0ABR8U524_9BACL|nr:metal ABC transporter permease [Sporosarcina quadrami]MBD7983142.1 metal ABC transporter permease [Sporosarcina quadrami]